MSARCLTSSTELSLMRATELQRRSVREREAVGHAGDVVGDPLRGRTGPRWKPLGLGDEPVENGVDDVARPAVLGRDLWPEIDVLEHEGAQREHRLADGRALRY